MGLYEAVFISVSVGPKVSLLGRKFVCVHVIVREICATSSASISVAAPVSSRRKASQYMGTNARRRSLAESPTTSPSSSKNHEKALAALGDTAPDFLSGFTPLSLPQPRGKPQDSDMFSVGVVSLSLSSTKRYRKAAG